MFAVRVGMSSHHGLPLWPHAVWWAEPGVCSSPTTSTPPQSYTRSPTPSTARTGGTPWSGRMGRM